MGHPVLMSSRGHILSLGDIVQDIHKLEEGFRTSSPKKWYVDSHCFTLLLPRFNLDVDF